MNPSLLAALIAVESSGNDLAVGDGGKAIGPLQIRAGVVQDVNVRYGTRYEHRQMTNRAIAKDVCVKYLRIYAPDSTPEHQARVWNGGPTGPRKSATVKYWNKVKRNMK